MQARLRRGLSSACPEVDGSAQRPGGRGEAQCRGTWAWRVGRAPCRSKKGVLLGSRRGTVEAQGPMEACSGTQGSHVWARSDGAGGQEARVGLRVRVDLQAQGRVPYPQT